jgi:hypothetical protein
MEGEGRSYIKKLGRCTEVSKHRTLGLYLYVHTSTSNILANSMIKSCIRLRSRREHSSRMKSSVFRDVTPLRQSTLILPDSR